MEASLVENYIRAKSQVEIQEYDLAGKLGILQGKFTKNSIARHEQASDTNPFRVLIYTMSPTYEQNMSSNGGYQLDGFPRKERRRTFLPTQ